MDINPGAYTLLRCTSTKLIGTPLTKAMPLLADAFQAFPPPQLIPLNTVKGNEAATTIWLEMSASRLYDHHNRLLGWLLIVRDRTEHYQMEQALRESEARLQAIFDNAAVGINLVDAQGHFLQTNRRVTEMLGYQPDELVDKTVWDVTYPDDILPDQEKMQAITAGTISAYRLEKRYVRKDGTLFWADLAVKAVPNKNNGNTNAVGIITDITERKRAEEILRQSEAHLNYLLSTSPVIIFSSQADADYAITFVSTNIQRILGYPPDAFTREPDFWSRHIHPDDAPTVFANLSHLFASGEYQQEYRFLHRDGSYRRVKNVLRLVRNDNGTPLEIIGAVEDITRYHEAERALSEVQTLLQGVLNHAPTLIYAKNLQGQLILVNRQLETLLAVNHGEALGKTDYDIQPTEIATRNWAADLEAQKSLRPVEREEQARFSDGTLRTYLSIKFPLFDHEGQLSGTCGISTDITERKQVEQELRQELSINLALTQLSHTLLVVDTFEEISALVLDYARFFTDSSQGFVGYIDPQTGSLIVPTLTSMYQQCSGVSENVASAPEVKTAVFQTFVGLWGWVLEHRTALLTNNPASDPRSTGTPHGHIAVERFLAVPALSGDTLLGKIALANADRDYTERDLQLIERLSNLYALAIQRKYVEEELKEARQVAEAATRAKSDFLATMSHEIRTPMNAVIGMTNLLMETPLNAEQYDYTNTIHISGDALLTLINDILDFSKIEAGRLELEEVPFNLRTCIEEALDLLAPKAAEKGLELVYWMDADMPNMLGGDNSRVRQILVNLLSNAVKFTECGEVLVMVQEPGFRDHESESGQQMPPATRPLPTIHLSVRDTGIGIPADKQDRLFQSFSQVDSSTTRKYGGTGLGLVISKRLAELMGGTIWVESEAGIGSTFHVTFMAEPASTEMQPFLAAEQPDLQGKRVLIVDENATSRQILAGYTTQWHMHTHAVGSPTAAFDWISQQTKPFQAILLNGHQPLPNIVSTIQQLRNTCLHKDVSLLVLVSLANRQQLANAALSEVTAFLVKPIRPAMLHTVLVNIIHGEPMQQQQVFDTHTINPQIGQLHPLRILLAEDNVVNQKVALRLLEKMGYRAHVAATGYEVLEALQHRHYDVILMDVQMPDMDGIETTRRIRQEWTADNAPHIIAMTAHAMESDRQWCLDAGMDDYVGKPVRVEELAAKLVAVGGQGAGVGSQGAGVGSQGAGVGSQSSALLPPLDATTYAHFLETMGGEDTETTRELIDLFLYETPEQLDTLQDALKNNNANNLFQAAHSLKSSCAMLGALPMAALCEQLEGYGRAGDTSDVVRKTCANLVAEFARVQAALQSG